MRNGFGGLSGGDDDSRNGVKYPKGLSKKFDSSQMKGVKE
jgi:hypothetical protein